VSNGFDLSSLSDAELEQAAATIRQQVEAPGATGVDRSEGADIFTRAGASFKSDPKERLSYVKARLGAENVATTPQGEIVWRKPGDKKWRAFDEAGLSLADVADFVGDVPEIAGATLGALAGGAGGSVAGPGGTVVGSVAGAAKGGALGNVAKQAISALLPGEESLRPVDRVKDVALSAAFSAGGQKLGNMLAKALSPSVRAAAPASQYAEEGERLARTVGGDLTAGQRTGSQTLRVTEDYLRRNPAAATIMSTFEVEKQIKPIKAYLDRTLEKMAATEVPDAALGETFRSTFDRGAKLLTEQVLEQGSRDFSFLTRAVGDTPIFEPRNFLGELRMLAQRLGDPTQPPAMRTFAGKAAELLEHYGKQVADGRYTATQMQNLLKQFGKAGYGRGTMTIIEGLEKSDQTRIARDLFQALTKDLDLAASATTTMPLPAGASATNVAKMLKQARNNYAQNMKAVDELGMSVIGKRLGKLKGDYGPERIAEWASKLRPSEMSATMDILETMRPGIRGETARNMIEKAMIEAAEAARTSGTGPAMSPLSPDVLLKHLPSEDTLKAILGPNSPSLKDMAEVMGYLGRVVERSTSSATIQVNPFLMAARHPARASGQLTAILAPKTMARLLTDAAAVKRLRILAQAAGRKTARAQEAASWLVQRGLPPAVIEGGIEARE
jgi:hypothetical protein